MVLLLISVMSQANGVPRKAVFHYMVRHSQTQTVRLICAQPRTKYLTYVSGCVNFKPHINLYRERRVSATSGRAAKLFGFYSIVGSGDSNSAVTYSFVILVTACKYCKISDCVQPIYDFGICTDYKSTLVS